ncbi:sensor histidine kinase N-terminal domain-containing protein, partial [Stenotrophomonas maltophilia]
YYTIRYQGRALTGYGDLPQISPGGSEDDTAFGDARYLNRDIRIVAKTRRLPGLDAPVLIEVAETLDARKADTDRLLTGLFVL